MAGCLVSWLIASLIGCFFDWLVGWLVVGWLVAWIAGWCVDWLLGGWVHGLFGCRKNPETGKPTPKANRRPGDWGL